MKSHISVIFYFLLTIACGACSSSKEIPKKILTQKYYDLSFTPDSVTKKIINNTEITVIPIDAKTLNREMYDASNRDGNYDREINSILETLNQRLSTASKQQKVYLQGKINAFEYLSKLEKDKKISPEIALMLKRKVNEERSGNDGSEPEIVGDASIFTDDRYNPYKLDDKYLSVFRITFENKGTEVEKINLKEFQLVSNQEQLYPLAFDYFENILKHNRETIKNAYRMNMPNELLVTGGQKITKYLAVPAINAANTKLEVQFIREKDVVNFDFEVNRKEVDKTYTLENYTLSYAGEGNEFAYKVFYIVTFKGNVSFPVKEDKVFVSNDKKQLPASVIAIGINTTNSDIVFAAEENFKFSGVSDNKKKIEFKKIKKDKETNKY